MLHPKSLLSLISFSISGNAASISQRETDCLVTLRLSAMASCVIPCSFRSAAIFSPIVM